jgi:hypothetical protein
VSENDSAWQARVEAGDPPLPTTVGWLAIGLNVLLFLTEVTYLIPRAGVRDTEVLAVSLLVGTPVVNLVMFLDYYRRGLWMQGSAKAGKGDPRPLPAPVRWLVIAMNVLLLFSETVLFLERGINIRNPLEVLVTSLMVTTTIVSLAMFLDYNRRRV